jgi:hypothetical protein
MCFYFRSVLFPYIKGSLRKITNTAAAEINNNNNCSANNLALAGIDSDEYYTQFRSQYFPELGKINYSHNTQVNKFNSLFKLFKA